MLKNATKIVNHHVSIEDDWLGVQGRLFNLFKSCSPLEKDNYNIYHTKVMWRLLRAIIYFNCLAQNKQ